MADETAPVTHAYQAVEVRDDENQPTGEWQWTCTCGAVGKPTKDAGAIYDAWIKHQQRTYEDGDGAKAG